MSEQELSRVRVLSLVVEGQLALHNAARHLGVSYRQARRLLRRLQQEGPRALAHGNRGRPPVNRLDPKLRRRVMSLAQGPYAICNDTHLRELLAEREGIHLSRETLRSWLRAAGCPPKRRRRPKKHHRRRTRATAKGLLVLWDGSPHRWLGPDQPEITLMAAIDDADGELLAAFFAPQETSAAYFQLLSQILLRHGIPISIYQDRHSALRRNDDSWSLQEQMAGRQRPTQVGLALEDLGIQPIFALSPQAKGRVERLFGVLQDRLLAEMQLDSITSIEGANSYLEIWIDRYNQRFRKPCAGLSAFRSRESLDLQKILAFRYQAQVLNDNTVRLGGRVFDIPPGPRGRSYAKAQVNVHQHLDGSWTVYYQNRILAQASPSPFAEPLRYKRYRKPTKRIKAAFDEQLLYLPHPITGDIFPLQLGGHIASA